MTPPPENDETPPSPAGADADAGGLEHLVATVERLRGEAEWVRRAAAGGAVIELAKGVLVERLRCTPAQAAEQLALLAVKAGVTPLEVAADVVNEVAGDRIGEAGEHDPAVSARLRAAESSALGAGDTQVVAASLLEHALAPLGATAVAVWEAEPGGALALAGQAGFGHEEARRWRHIPPGVPTPASRTLRERRLLWHPSTTLPAIGHPQPEAHSPMTVRPVAGPWMSMRVGGG
ncbi:ANTAR domain-containing protein [Nonomuraea sp. NPDC049421]|uniref:ANTAR domain-containing protein n=1 Tax=Nonomuraea sp. NPDC049421 TaxID=3155275 RepID=UPI0034331402